MSLFREVQLDESFGPFAAYVENYGFVPNLFRSLTLLPRLIEAHEQLERVALIHEGTLSRIQKQRILIVAAGALGDVYTVTAHATILKSMGVSSPEIHRLLVDFRGAGLGTKDTGLLDFCEKLSLQGTSVDASDIERLRSLGWDDSAVLESVLTCALAHFLSVLSAGLSPVTDFEPYALPPRIRVDEPKSRSSHSHVLKGPYLKTVYQSPVTFAPFARMLKTHGFVPNLYRAQTLRPEIVTEESAGMARILAAGDILSRPQKEAIFIAASAAILNSYCVAAHCNLLRNYGLSPEEADQIALDHSQSNLPDREKVMLDFAVKIATRMGGDSGADVARLKNLGFTDEQVLECIALTAASNFLNIVRLGLGVEPDFELPPGYEQNKLNLSSVGARLTAEDEGATLPSAAVVEDPDAGLVAIAKAGDLEAFEQLIRHHSPLVYRTLIAILGSADEAQDAMQDTLVSSFKHLAKFQGKAKFSTWLVSIARNTALQRLRTRRPMESLDQPGESDRDFRPRQIRSWQDDPEQLHSKEEIRQIVERGIMELPAKYRIVVVLRDIEQLPTDEVARQLGLSVPAVKTRLLRGRLMLREALSPHFTTGAEKAAI